MGTAVGDLVYAMSIDNSRWGSGIDRGIGDLRRLDGAVATQSMSAKKSLGYLANAFGEASVHASMFSETAGAGFSSMSMGIFSIIAADDAVRGLGKAYRWAAAQQSLMAVASGPAGWIALAASVIAVGAAYAYHNTIGKETTEVLKGHVKAIDDLKEKRTSLILGAAGDEASYMTGSGREEFDRRNENLKGAEDKLRQVRKEIAINQDVNDRAQFLLSYDNIESLSGEDRLNTTRELLDAQEKMAELKRREYAEYDEVQRYKDLENQATARKEANEAIERESEKYEQLLRSLMKVENAYTMTAAERDKLELRQSGLSEDHLSILDAQIDRNEIIKKQAEEEISIMQEAAGIWRENQTAEEKYYDSIQRNQELYWAGLLTDEMLERANMKALDEWGRAEKGGAAKTGKTAEGPKALEKGSQEAWQFIVAAMNPQNDTNLDIADNTRRAADALERIDNKEVEEVDLPA